MNEKRKKRMCRTVPLALGLMLCLAGTAAAVTPERTLVPMGQPLGIKLFAKGVLVVELSEGESAARRCGLKTGDVLLTWNQTPIQSTEHLQALLQETAAQEAELTAQRGSRTLTLPVTAQKGEDGVYRLGAWIRDSIAGIGTMTFYDPETNSFAALGHGVTDTDTALLMPLSSGAVMHAEVKAVKKGTCGVPGELRGDFDLTQDCGTLYANTDAGVFGTLTPCDYSENAGRAVPLASRAEVEPGQATILATISGDTAQAYEIEIEKVYSENAATRNLLVRVTDERLLAATGGIVQGMSGSPILQNGKLVGAVTHVLVNDPTLGYGILIENMLDAAACASTGAA